MSTSDVPADDGSNAAPSPEQPTCAVCLEQLDPPSRGADGERAAMPCCDRDGATMAFCVGCVDIICSQGPGGVGRCPKCRALVRRSNDGARGVFVGAELQGTCRMCLQSRTIVDVERNVCDACELGARHALRYECRACAVRPPRLSTAARSSTSSPPDRSRTSTSPHRILPYPIITGHAAHPASDVALPALRGDLRERHLGVPAMRRLHELESPPGRRGRRSAGGRAGELGRPRALARGRAADAERRKRATRGGRGGVRRRRARIRGLERANATRERGSAVSVSVKLRDFVMIRR